MSAGVILICIGLYFAGLLSISWFTGKNETNEGYFIGNRQSPWFVVAFGMIGDSLSGVTFISLPGTIVSNSFAYLQLVMGYLAGYAAIALILLPVYYKLRLTSIYAYLLDRFGSASQKTGSFYFLVSRLFGAGLRLLLAVNVLQLFVFDAWGIPFPVSVALIVLLMLVYTYRGGIKTLIWTDLFQSGFLLLAVVLSIWAILNQLNWSLSQAVSEIYSSRFSATFFWDWKEKNFFVKQFLSGAFITIVMTGLDQNMMQKNLSIRTLPEARKNIFAFSGIVFVVNLFFLSLGALIYIYVEKSGIQLPVDPTTLKLQTDKVFPYLAINHLGLMAALVFIVGLTAATFNSADSVLTTLTTSFCIDFLGFDTEQESTGKEVRIRHAVHAGFAILLWLCIVLSRSLNQTSILDAIFTIAAFTYGPLLGLFAFGLFTHRKVRDKFVPVLSIIPPLVSLLLYLNSEAWFGGYKFSYELLLINGLIMFFLLWLFSNRNLAIKE
ncbi:sodium:solute symporter [Bacteroidota bacterium]